MEALRVLTKSVTSLCEVCLWKQGMCEVRVTKEGAFIWMRSAKDETGKGVASRFNDPVANLGFPRYTGSKSG